MIKQYYRIEFKLTSAMNIGCGTNDKSDNDIIRDSRNQPYIPGNTIAGIFRTLLDDKRRKDYMGEVKINRGSDNQQKENASESKLIIYDAVLKENDAYRTSVRDCVALDAFKTAKTGAKFDFEILEPDCCFVTFIEQDMEDGDENIALMLVSTWKENGLRFGAKTMRGLGAAKIISVKKASFDLNKEIDAWLDFNLYDENCWKEDLTEEEEQPLPQEKIILNLGLKQCSGISIRKYTTKVNKPDSQVQPDYEQLYYERWDGAQQRKIPIIPGTTWAGAFRHHLSELGLDEEQISHAFGCVDRKGSCQSQIAFMDTELKDCKEKYFTRNAIDRFTGGTIDGALYTESFCFDGTGELSIFLKTETDLSFKQALAAAITDLHFGMLAVGGLTGVGRGLFKLTKINNSDIQSEMTADQIYHLVLGALILQKGGR